MSGTGSPVAIDPQPPSIPPYFDSRLQITSIDSAGGGGAIIQGQDFTVSGTAEAFPSALDTSGGAPFASNVPVYVFARPVSEDGSYGPAQLLGISTLTDTGQTDGNYFGEELYSWSLSGLSTSTLPNGLYDLEAFQIGYTYFSQNGDELRVPTVSNHPAFNYVNVTPANTQSFGAGIDAGSADLSEDGRYVTYTVGSDVHVRDLQTGKDSLVTGVQPTPGGPYATIHPFQSNEFSFANGNEEVAYSGTITAGNLTFGAIGSDHPYAVAGTQPYDLNGYYNGYDARVFPTVTDNTTGVTTLLNAEGIPIATSDNGDAVLSQGFVFNGLGDASPPYGYVVNFVAAAPTLTLDPINGTNSAGDFAGDPLVTLTGTSNAIGQEVEIDVAAAQAGVDPSQEYGAGVEAGLAKVAADGTWHFTFDPASYTPSTSGLFIEASVSSTAGTPARTSQTVAVITTPPVVTQVSAYATSGETQVGAGDTITIDVALAQNAPPVSVSGTPMLTLSNGQEASYSASASYTVGGYPFGATQQVLAFTYTPGLPDASGPLSVTGLDLDGGSIADSAGDPLTGPFGESLGLSVQTSPVLQYVSTLQGFSGSNETNDATPSVSGYAVVDNAGDVVTLFDGTTVLGSVALPYYGQSYATYFSVPVSPATALADGEHDLTAVLSVGSLSPSTAAADESRPSAPLAIIVDTIPPPEAVSSLAVNDSNVVGLADQASGDVTITGTLTGPLQAGDTVEITLSDGQTEAATNTLPGNGFELDVSADDVAHFGVGGVVSAYVADAAGNQSPTLAQSYAAASVRTIGVASATSADPLSSPSQQPSLSGNGEYIAFDVAASYGEGGSVSGGMGGMVFTPGLYVEDLATGTAALTVTPANSYSQLNLSGTALSSDGDLLAYSGPSTDGYEDQVYVRDIAAGTTMLVSQAAGSNGATAGDGSVYAPPSLSADGDTITFEDTADNLVPGSTTGEQVFVGTRVGGAYQLTVASAPDGGFEGTGGDSFAPVVSADGGSVAFSSLATNLLAAATALPSGTAEIYVKTLTDNAATGLKAGSVTLVSASGAGTAADTGGDSASISGNSRYVVFGSSASNLLPSTVKLPSGTEEIYVKDLATGAIALVSQTAAGVIADSYSSDAAISADGRTVVFSSSADNLVAGLSGQQLYAKNLDTGTLTLLSEPGAIPGDGSSGDPSVSADGSVVAFDSRADNLVADANPATAIKSGEHVYTTTLASQAATTVTVTNTNDSGAGSLRAALAATISGDTIDFAPAIAGGTITLASTLTVSNGVTIDGSGENITVDGNDATTVFTIDDSSAVAAVIEGVTIGDGKGQGVPASTAQPNLPGGAATGGIDVKAGTVQLTNDRFTGNSATGGAGGAATAAKGAGGAMGGNAGGAIYVASGTTLSATNLTFTGNTATGGVGGTGAPQKGTGGTGGTAAGGIYVDPSAVLSATDLTFDGNTATGGAGGASGTSSGTPSGNPFKPGIGGSAAGAIYADPHATARSTGASFMGNSATVGVGFYDQFDPTPYAYADTDIGGNTGQVATSGTAEDGYIVGGTVAYLNGSGQPTTTDSHGAFMLTGGTGPIELTGGTDSATGLAFTGTLTAPTGSTILSPLTTLVEAVVEASGDTSAAGIAAAQAAVKAALDLPPGVDLTTYDAEGALLGAGNDPTALDAAERVYAASTYLQGVEQAIDAAGGSSSGALQAVAQQLAGGQTIDLTDPSTLVDQGALTQPGAAAAVLSIVNGTISAVQDQVSNTADPMTAFVDITGAGIAVQQDGTAALAQALSQGDQQGFDDAASNYNTALPTTLSTDDGQVTDDAAPCFCPGTLILTDAGEVAVERLAVGDRVITADGAAEPIVWIGRRSYAGRFVAGNHLMLPVCFKAGSLADGVPQRDLFVSPGHAMMVDGQLVPAWRLVNGVSIRQAPAVDQVTYIHVELARHALLFAEGAVTESFLDDGCRGQFHAATGTAHPDAPAMTALAPRLEDGFALQAVRDRLAARAGVLEAVEPAGPLRGYVDVAGTDRVCGWAQDIGSPEEPVALELLVDGGPVVCVLANAYRADLRRSGLGSGCHAFDIALPGGFAGAVQVRRVGDQAVIASTDLAVGAAKRRAA